MALEILRKIDLMKFVFANNVCELPRKRKGKTCYLMVITAPSNSWEDIRFKIPQYHI